MYRWLNIPLLPSVLWRCWLGGRKGIRPVKNMEWWGAGVVICLERGASDLHIWFSWCHCHPIISCFSKIHNGLSFWYRPTQVGLGKKAVKRLCVCVINSQVWSCKYTVTSKASCAAREIRLTTLSVGRKSVLLDKQSILFSDLVAVKHHATFLMPCRIINFSLHYMFSD